MTSLKMLHTSLLSASRFNWKIYVDVLPACWPISHRSEQSVCGRSVWSSVLSDVWTWERSCQCISHEESSTLINTAEMQGSIMVWQAAQVSGGLVCLVSNVCFFLYKVLDFCAKGTTQQVWKHQCSSISKSYFQCLVLRMGVSAKTNMIRYQGRYFRHILNLCSLQHAVNFLWCSNSIW